MPLNPNLWVSTIDVVVVDIKEDYFWSIFLPFFELLQNETLTPNESEGILINEFSLVLQNVGHHSIGKYMCLAANDAGKGSSQQVFLDVKCKTTFD